MLPPLGMLRAFEAAARLTSFSRAADELHVTHAAVSHQIRLLEEWFGRPLFLREKRGVRLAPEAEGLAATLTATFERIGIETERLRLNAKAQVSVACIPSIATRWLIPALSAFVGDHPEVDVKVVYAMAEQQLRQTGCDILITLGADRSEDTRSDRLFSRLNRPVASPGYIDRKGQLNSPEAIACADLLHDETTSRWRDWYTRAGQVAAQPLRGPVFQDFNLLATAVIAGHGVALCPVEVFRREIESGDLVVLSEVATLEDEGYFLITKTTRSKAVAAFSEWFSAIVKA
ncbi:MAG TPA: LysR substrate-binding domain-containing protein [Ensifer sp.]|jgi:DNA-binding transcriptional LysR family regulator|uniref:LysR substrate-binding domain-containing protein n=1 Tax=Ensifer sp. TaxID=1872086 RepID=UPI002E0D767A|nr:LysR substrate-binding domain-containing protein [Ensifer sp.]